MQAPPSTSFHVARAVLPLLSMAATWLCAGDASAQSSDPRSGAPTTTPTTRTSPTAPTTPTPPITPPTTPPSPPSPEPPGATLTPLEPAPPPGTVPAPAPFVYGPPSKHAPHTAFWVGGQLGLIGYGGAFFVNGRNKEESSGNFVGEGASLEVDAGARLNKRYLPYVLVEYAVLGAGGRFESDTRTRSSLVGLGFRFVIGNVDKAGFLADLSIAQRIISVSHAGEEMEMRGPELFRLGLGAELRLSNALTLSPIFHLSGGSMEQSTGTVRYAQPQGDGEIQPTFQEGSIGPSQRSYLVVGIGCGAHFDLFGR